MFVSVVLDPGGVESANALVTVLAESGFKKVQRACWESVDVTEARLSELKKNIDRVTDYYDTVRLYQFPVEGMFVITELKQKRWKRCRMKGNAQRG
ncbi:MAG: CRISPR-associated protein Cas2 [Treponema sp.]|nr:CRISPR-associated protein Cas2 [Treponema sp.]